MLQINAGRLFEAMLYLTSLSQYVSARKDDTPGYSWVTLPQFPALLESAEAVVSTLTAMKLTTSVASAKRVHQCLLEASKGDRLDGSIRLSGTNLMDFLSNVDTLAGRIQDELSTSLMISIEYRDKEYYKQDKGPLFGADVATKMPNLQEDIAEAAKCLALGRYTASVFHLMRAMEATVRQLAQSLDVGSIDRDWGTLLSVMKMKIEAIPKGPLRDKWSETLTLLYHVKQAWRNNTMHPKQTYTEEEARSVYEATRSFIRQSVAMI